MGDINDEFEITFTTNRKMKIPHKLGIYNLEKKIIEVKNCVVLATHNPENGQKLAIKCIPIKIFQNNSREVEIMQLVQHDHVVSALNSFFYPDQNPRFFSIVMHRATSDLLDYINYHHYLPEPIVFRIMKDSIEAVKALHTQNIWHRDIKLDNIFVIQETRSGPRVAVADFGLADVFNQEIITSQGVGTVEYAAPELLEITGNALRFKPLAEYTNKVDSWSLGVVMFGLLCGKLPFNRYNREDAERLLEGNVVFEPLTDDPNDAFNRFQAVSEEAKDLIRSLLCLDPDQRLSVDDALDHPWFRMLYEAEQQFEQQNDDIFRPLDDDDEIVP